MLCKGVKNILKDKNIERQCGIMKGTFGYLPKTKVLALIQEIVSCATSEVSLTSLNPSFHIGEMLRITLISQGHH